MIWLRRQREVASKVVHLRLGVCLFLTHISLWTMSKNDQSLPSGKEKVFTEVIVRNKGETSMEEVL